MSMERARVELPLEPLRVAPARALVAAAAVGIDMFVAAHERAWWLAGVGPQSQLGWYALRGGIACVALVVLLATRASAPRHHGLRGGGAVADLRWVLGLALIVVAAYAVAAAVGVLTLRAGWWSLPAALPRDLGDRDDLARAVPVMLLAAPLVEEAVYRALAVPALAAVAGRRGALWLSGPLFLALHVAYGYPAWLLHYVVAGWLLALAFLRRGRLWVVVLLHALGNVLMLLDDVLLLWAPGFVRWVLGPHAPASL
jgi:membrane protease YdiL (CAAX protease family)